MQKLNRCFVGAVGILLIALSTTAEAGTLTLAWDPPSTGTPPQGYAIAWGFQSGVYTDYVDVGLATSHTFTNLIDGQTYFFAAFTYAAGVPSTPSNELRFGGCSAAPGAPANLSASVANTLVTLGWHPPGGETPKGYRVQVGSSSGLTDLANILVTTTSLTGEASAGTYYIRVLGVNDCGEGPASTEVAVTVGSSGGRGKKAPGAPRNPRKQVFSGAVTLSWDPPATGDAPERYVIEVSDNHGRSANVDTGNAGTSVSGHVPPGTYHVKIRAANSGGMGPATSVITIVVTP